MRTGVFVVLVVTLYKVAPCCSDFIRGRSYSQYQYIALCVVLASPCNYISAMLK